MNSGFPQQLHSDQGRDFESRASSGCAGGRLGVIPTRGGGGEDTQ